MVLLWEAADRICGKRLKALLPVLIESMERHGHLRLDPVVRSGLWISARLPSTGCCAQFGKPAGRHRGGVGAWARRSSRACRCDSDAAYSSLSITQGMRPIPSGSEAVEWNTSALPNGVYYLNVGVWNSTGLVEEEGTSQGIEVTIVNSISNPAVTVNPTPQPTPVQDPGGCSVAIASPTTNAGLSGTATVNLTENCPGFALNRLYVGTVPAPPVNQCPSPGECVQFAPGSKTVQFDTTRLPDGVWYLNVGVWNSSGLVEQGRTYQGMQVTIANGSSTPTPPPPQVWVVIPALPHTTMII